MLIRIADMNQSIMAAIERREIMIVFFETSAEQNRRGGENGKTERL
jgi:hypothetical protein